MADTVHEVFVDLTAEALAFHISSALSSVGAVCLVYRGIARKRAVQELIGFVDAVSNLRDDDALASEAGHSDVLVSSDDDAVSSSNLFIRQDVLRTAGAVGLDFDADAALLGMLLKALGSHERVGDTRRASRDSEDLDVVSSRSSRLFFSSRSDELAVFFVVNELEEFFLRLSGDQSLFEVRIHDHRSELRQDGEVLIIGRIRCSNHEEQAARVAIHGLKVHARWNCHGSKASCFNACALGMRRGNAITEARRARSFTGKDVFRVLFLVGQVAASLHEVSELIDCSGFVSRSRTQQDAVALEQISNTHGISPF